MKDRMDIELQNLADGVPSVYRSKRYKRKVAVRITAGLLSLILCCAGLFFAFQRKPLPEAEPEWNGRVIILQTVSIAYDQFFEVRFFPYVFNKLDMTKEVFEENANVEVYDTSDCQEILDEIYGGGVDCQQLEYHLFLYVILLDENGSVLMEGSDQKAFLEALAKTDFLKIYERKEGG